jgi:hypothetical protein
LAREVAVFLSFICLKYSVQIKAATSAVDYNIISLNTPAKKLKEHHTLAFIPHNETQNSVVCGVNLGTAYELTLSEEAAWKPCRWRVAAAQLQTFCLRHCRCTALLALSRSHDTARVWNKLTQKHSLMNILINVRKLKFRHYPIIAVTMLTRFS